MSDNEEKLNELIDKIEKLGCSRERLLTALLAIAAFHDTLASIHLDSTGSYSAFDEPHSVEIARNALKAQN